MSEAARSAVEASSDASISNEEYFRRYVVPLAKESASSPAAEVSRMMDVLSEGVASGHAIRAAFLAGICYVHVENGIDSPVFTRVLLERMRDCFDQVRPLAEAFEKLIPVYYDTSEDEGISIGNYEELRRRFPVESQKWDEIEIFVTATITVLSASAENRPRGQILLPGALAIANVNSSASWISRLLCVLDDEPLVALEPGTLCGFVGRMYGISCNFQLNIFLMDVFPPASSTSRRRVSEKAVQTARGFGPRTTSETIAGNWNLYAWTILRGCHHLPKPADYDAAQHWVRYEGIPADIPSFENQRVVVIGPPAYQRVRRLQRDFQCLKADLKVERILTAAEVDDWITKLRNA